MPARSRFVFDTNAVISAALLKASVSRRAFDKALDVGTLLVSAETIEELNDVLGRPGGGRAIALAAEHPALRTNVHDYLVVPDSDRFLAPILAMLPAQLVAYQMSVARGIDPDFPRNLSKTLTVD